MALTSNTLKGIYLPIGLPASYWSTSTPKAALFDLLSLMAGGNASTVAVTPTGNLSSTNVQAALEELQSDIDAFVSGSIPTYTKTFTDITTDTILAAEHLLTTVHNVVIKTPADKVVSIQVDIVGTTVIINSNISLLNHKLIIY
jgi:hypothetical protein